jgi:UDP-2,3-diacylglucosamine pyrophosphatase LpxH
LHHDRDPFRTLFISDVHLGSPGCRAEMLLEFLQRIRAETLFLVGDIVDVESLSQRFFWPQHHNDVLRAFLAHARRGTRVVYIPGNHDIQARAYAGLNFGRVEIRRHAIHESAAGKKYLVMHGDELDQHLRRDAWRHRLGSLAYRHLLKLNGHVNDQRRKAGLNYWPLASSLKHRSRAAQAYMENFRAAAIACAASRGVDGCITGHIHRPEIYVAEGIEYLNCGDWVEHCTGLAEHTDGRLELIDWARASAVAWPRAA